MKPTRPKTHADGNLLYPLPPDYNELSVVGQRDARRNAVFLQETPEDMVWAWVFFRQHYLLSLPAGDWYKPPVYDSPRLHYEYILDIGRYARNVEIFPRSYAKTTLLNELLLLWSATACGPRRGFSVLLIKSTDGFAKEVGTKLQFQWVYNERFVNDFGNLRPKRTDPGSWSKTQIWLRNGFKLDVRSVMGKLPGYRPNIWLSDDAEYDQTKKVSQAELSAQFGYMLKNHLIPMLDIGCAGCITTTLYNRKMHAYKMATADESEDPSLAFWNRRVVAVKTPQGELTWPEKFPDERLEQLKIEVGMTAYKAQYMNDPGSSEEAELILHPKFSYYTVKNPDEPYVSFPCSSGSTLVTWTPGLFDHSEPTKVERPFGKTVSKMYRIVLADPIKKASATSDFACILVIGIERTQEFKDVWWLLDIYLGRPNDVKFLETLWELGYKWQVRLVGVESIGVQKQITERARQLFADQSGRVQWAPRVFGITYKREFGGDRGKAARIGGLSWRFDFHKVKLPLHLMHAPGWRELKEQIDNFTEDLSLLAYDDALDTLAMTQFVVRPKGVYFPMMNTAPHTVTEMLQSGIRHIPGTKIDVTTALNFDELTPDQAVAINEMHERDYLEALNKKPTFKWGRSSRQPRTRRTGRRRMVYGTV